MGGENWAHMELSSSVVEHLVGVCLRVDSQHHNVKQSEENL